MTNGFPLFSYVILDIGSALVPHSLNLVYSATFEEEPNKDAHKIKLLHAQAC